MLRSNRGRWASIAAAVMVAACSGPIPTPTDSAAGTTVDCTDLPRDRCAKAADVAVAAVRGQGPIVRVELGRGVWCPTPGLLFSNTTCPGGGLPPEGGGQWIGHALITFASSGPQAYLNVAEAPNGMRAALIALATPPPSSAP